MFARRLIRVIIPALATVPRQRGLIGAVPRQRRLATIATGNAPPSSPPLDDITYHKYADETIDLLMDFLDALGDGHDIPGYDAVYANGVVTLKLGSVGTYVVNKQPPNKQLWLSSPSSGPKRYDYDSARHKWVYAHDNLAIEDLLKQELERALKIKVDLDLSVPRAH